MRPPRLLRVPGLGVKSVNRLLSIRRWQRIRLEDLVALKAGIARAMPFIVCANHRPAVADAPSAALRARFAPPAAAQQTFDF